MQIQAPLIGAYLEEFVAILAKAKDPHTTTPEIMLQGRSIQVIKNLRERFSFISGLRLGTKEFFARALTSLEKNSFSQGIKDAEKEMHALISYSFKKLSSQDKKLLYNVLPQEFKN